MGRFALPGRGPALRPRLLDAQRIANLGNWDWNIETGELHWSDQIYRIFGLEPQQFGATYEAFLDAVHPDDRGMLQVAVDRALSEGEVYAIDHRIVLPGGEERIVHEQGEVIFGASGNPLRMSGTVQDITEQKRVEREIRELNEELEQRVEARTEALRDSEEQLRLITNNVPAAIAYLNANQTYEFINKRYEEWFGISSEDAHGRRVQDVVGKAAPNSIEENLAKALSGKLVSFETSIQTGEAGIRDVLATYVPHYSDAGTVRGVFVLVTDITERKRLENELLRQERLATLGQLTATVSHELRNPLGVIRTSAYTLRKSLDTTSPYAGRALERVERSVVRCDRIIEELLDFTRISELEPALTLLDDWLDDVLDDQALPPGVVLRRDLGLPGTKVSFDRDRLRRAVINVFDNACQAMQGEGEGATTAGDRVLTVHTRAHADRVELVFEDRGPGIAPEICERIFEPLFSTKGFGVGLGLPVVKQIMEQQGGGIDVQTEIGRGTTVRLWLGPEVGMKGAAA